MNGLEISTIAATNSYTRRMFGGVFSCDTIPLFPNYFPLFYIVNTDKIKNKGKHWVFIYLSSEQNPIEWFDSLGFLPSHYSKKLHRYVTKNGTSPFLSSVEPVQNSSSSACGQFCLVMGDMRGRGLSYKKSMRFFDTEDLTRNDELVRRYVEERMRKRD